ncbi:1-acyl-sn-glycerol-3-phosphate acyltransferase [Macellibacteroides fermentans]|jgi:1-acyl-sn-glycerol-3-phosphate acyltransferase|uniref:1-acyl-sn-glycerol-3-phosphate acyltransferase n=1 Tax=Macellibacteroides fermentans TaxID=879969 RepID=UPI00082B7845|nr:1-acyl-sn-glycerol-3-phosphate acyltransferase [Parabacteroides sp.]OCW95008.1 acyltransferase [Macellibacteroides sp. HH-ZS]
MRVLLSKFLLNLAGWKLGPVGEDVPKCVVCVAPHTSNWDFIIGKLFYSALDRDAGFLIKKDWFFFPFNLFFSWLGGVPVDRDKRTSVTDQMVEEFAKRDSFHLGITPEGTRKKVTEWKKGFYFIALKANVPIVLAYLDYGKKEAGVKTVFYPTGDFEKDIETIRSYYKGVQGRNAENFVE